MNKKKIIYNWFSSQNNGYGLVVSNYILRLNALGYTLPSDTVLAALNSYFEGLGSATYSRFDMFHSFAFNNASLSNAMTVNIVKPTLSQGAFVNSPTIATDGFQGNGSTSYFDTGYNPATLGINYTLNAASRGFDVRTAPTSGNAYDGVGTGGATRNSCIALSSNQQRINSGSNNLNSVVDLTGTGYRAINRSTSTNVQLYSGLTKSDRTQTSVSVISGNQHVGRNDGGAYSNTKFTMYYMGGNFTETEHNNIRNGWLNYLTSIGL